MGQMNFLLPPGLAADWPRELSRAYLAGGFDNAPAPLNVRLDGNQLTISRPLDESGSLIIPWDIDSAGRLMTSTSTLIEGEKPYSLALELARGKVHQLRSHMADWRLLGFPPTEQQEEQLAELSKAFGQTATLESGEIDHAAHAVLRDAFRLTDELLPYYADRLFALRHQRVPHLDTMFGCQLSALPREPGEFVDTFNSVRVPLTWREIEPAESRYNWDTSDAVVDWAIASGLTVTAGPLIDFSRGGLPDWLSLWEGDVPNLANFMCDYVETAVIRYRDRIKRWQLTSSCNFAGVFNLDEDEMLWLTTRLAEAALQIAPELELVVSVAQPWGEYLAQNEHTYTPLVFLDTLFRTGLRLAAIDLEIVMGVSPRGSYCRDLLDVSRLLDHYAVLSAPIHVTLAFPSSTQPDDQADAELSIGTGHWKDGYSSATQASWAESFAAIVLSKPFVVAVYWSHLSDAAPHQFPNCGLLDAGSAAKPAMARLRKLRVDHLR